ncbi:HAMP domain-containing sensor histidine kinase [uncultured Roseibium sp.]|uniref:sensor histidine kinase n=1 Tax=uncultured Roseibium sp. TaxID=1936171 RepID=UPI0032171EBC
MFQSFRDRWRPPLSVIVAVVLGIMLVVPLAGIVFFRVYETELIQATEAELISQSAAIAAAASERLLELGGAELKTGAVVPESIHYAWSYEYADPDDPWFLLRPQLDLAKTTVLPDRPDPEKARTPADPVYIAAGLWLDTILKETQKRTLAGFRVLDFNGTVIAGRGDIGLSFAEVPEVKAALSGRYGSALRERVVNNPQPIYSISRGSSVRVFTALPIEINGRVAGVVYASRTPSNILREMYLKREAVFGVLAFALGSTFLVGFIFLRGIAGPIRALTARSLRIGNGDRDAIRPLAIHGSREIHALSTSLLDMSRKLFERNDYINTFATHVSHELKSPLTSIQGAAELLLDGGDTMSEPERARFLKNILEDTERASLLLTRLRALARADSVEIGGSCRLAEVLKDVGCRFEGLEIACPADGVLLLSEENAKIVFENLIDNSARHGADRITFEANQGEEISILICDNGTGISEGNRDQIFDLFFTTRREAGGTGMGLGIARTLLKAHGGTIELEPSDEGACFRIVLPGRGE